MTLQATHGSLVPDRKIDFVQFKNVKFASSMKLFDMHSINGTDVMYFSSGSFPQYGIDYTPIN